MVNLSSLAQAVAAITFIASNSFLVMFLPHSCVPLPGHRWPPPQTRFPSSQSIETSGSLHLPPLPFFGGENRWYHRAHLPAFTFAHLPAYLYACSCPRPHPRLALPGQPIELTQLIPAWTRLIQLGLTHPSWLAAYLFFLVECWLIIYWYLSFSKHQEGCLGPFLDQIF